MRHRSAGRAEAENAKLSGSRYNAHETVGWTSEWDADVMNDASALIKDLRFEICFHGLDAQFSPSRAGS
ncbi:hypothetical protein PIIN_09494 [Serendipita indica DSM 11827]|uniref:Uncharacterized protein n=1 Tax=Serendipita indica (strain DSM 11827) TaxID=1109443 RepID=G4TW18_SERID|nr:hypothetical protein PIIN_09494 [Serendipita indica DSM 11827]